MTCMAKWIVAIGLIAGISGVLWADAKGDLDSAKRDYESVKSKYDLDQAKAVRNRAKDLKSQNEVKDDASRLYDDTERLVENTDKLMEKTQSDWKSLDNVKQGTMNGANHPRIRAKMEYGKEMHVRLQGSRGCDEREVVLSSGRPDCIKFEPDNCKIIEFKPSTYSESAARDQAARYIDDVKRKFKDDDRAKKCKQKDGYPDFIAVGETYTACN